MWQNSNTISIECNIKFVNVFTDITIQPDETEEPPAPPTASQQPAPQQIPPKMPQPTSQPSQPCQSQRAPKLSQLVQQIAQGEFTTSEEANKDHHADDETADFVTTLIKEVENDPKSLSKAQACSNWSCWKEAMDTEITTLDHASTWSDVPRLAQKNIIGSKWVFQIK